MYNKLIIEKKIKDFIIEDCNFTDVTAHSIPEDSETTAKIIAKSVGYVSGLYELQVLYGLLGVKLTFNKKDGDAVKKGDLIVKLNGKANAILLGERVGLNLMSLMSAITSTTRKYIDIVKKTGKIVKIACTRKTLPGLRIFEKKAVELGGGDTHRFSLDDMILLKDTHLRFYNGDVKKLLEETKKKASFTKKIEIELEKIDDVVIAAENGGDIIMLDNMNPTQINQALELLIKNKLRKKVLIELSGGINVENIIDYIETEPDIISLGHITQFPTEFVDLSLRFD